VNPMTDRSDQQPWQDFDLVMRATTYAATAHRGDLRKGTSIPYLSHLWSVAALVLEHGGDDEQVAAALLHDVAEDHGGAARIDDIRAHFGDEVARLVEALSDSLVDTDAGEVKPPWRERKDRYLEHLAGVDNRVALVSGCDKLHNARAILSDLRSVGPDFWDRFTVKEPADHVWYYASLVETLSGKVPEPLGDELRRTVDAIKELVAKGEMASFALSSLPQPAVGVVSRERLVAETGGHAFGGGVHIGWAWGVVDPLRGMYLDFLWEHRMAGITASRIWQDGTREGIPTPAEFRVVLPDPDEDARSEREDAERNRRAYADLRERGLLPPAGQNLGSQDINEYLRTRESED
jgi:hypothetical protein